GGSDFALAAARRGVLVTPGEAFATDRGTGAGAVRVSLTGTDTREELRAGLEALAALLRDPVPASGPHHSPL
ncbi:MAG TPA: hypothetical protein VHG51_01330, partial [Longimicrobiaceae bacterium]|nr:hypothetical protein [Longimicrobiaceae bacterium]